MPWNKEDKIADAPALGVSLTILLTLFAAHNLYPTVRSFTTPFFQLSYYQPETGLYSTGWDDAYYVFSTILALTAIRAMFIDWIFRPLARKAGLKKKASMRFAEQAWLFVYDLSVWSFGMVGMPAGVRDVGHCWADLFVFASISGRIRTTGVISRPSGTIGPNGSWEWPRSGTS